MDLRSRENSSVNSYRRRKRGEEIRVAHLLPHQNTSWHFLPDHFLECPQSLTHTFHANQIHTHPTHYISPSPSLSTRLQKTCTRRQPNSRHDRQEVMHNHFLCDGIHLHVRGISSELLLGGIPNGAHQDTLGIWLAATGTSLVCHWCDLPQKWRASTPSLSRPMVAHSL